MTNAPERHREVSARTAAEHNAMVQALHVLERAMAAPAPGREEAWLGRAGAALAVVVDALRQHRESAEAEGGLLAEVETKVGRTREYTAARSHHEEMLAEAERLLEDLSGHQSPGYQDVRDRVAKLAAAVRHHHALEADLVMVSLDLDIGVGD